MWKKELGPREVERLRKLFEEGSRVEAVSVAGIAPGAMGTVKCVRRTGDIEVIFDKYGEIVANYPLEVVRIVEKGYSCMLNMKRSGKDAECRDDCKRCAWNPEVGERRKELLKTGMKHINGKTVLVLRRQQGSLNS